MRWRFGFWATVPPHGKFPGWDADHSGKLSPLESPLPRRRGFSRAAIMARNINKIVKTISFRGFVAMGGLYHGGMLVASGNKSDLTLPAV